MVHLPITEWLLIDSETFMARPSMMVMTTTGQSTSLHRELILFARLSLKNVERNEAVTEEFGGWKDNKSGKGEMIFALFPS